MRINWTTGHSSIDRNEIADQPAKEAATDASNQPEGNSSTNLSEIKEASTKTQLKR